MIIGDGMEGKLVKTQRPSKHPRTTAEPEQSSTAKKQPRKANLIVRKAYNNLRTLTVHKKGPKANFNPLNLQPGIIGAANTPCLMEM